MSVSVLRKIQKALCVTCMRGTLHRDGACTVCGRPTITLGGSR